MYKGKVKFTAKLTDNTIAFPQYRFQPAVAGVESIEIDTLLGDRITASVEVASVATSNEGIALAHSAVETALNRLAYFHQVAIDRAKLCASEFTSMQPGAGYVISPSPGLLALQGQTATLVAGIGHQQLKAALEPATQPGEHNFGALRSARLSVSPVEEFMHLYSILIWMCNDKQDKVDALIRSIEPGVAQTQHPLKPAGVMETIYTRLRNELAHRRAGVTIEQTKQSMVSKVGDLRGIVKEAIQRNP